MDDIIKKAEEFGTKEVPFLVVDGKYLNFKESFDFIREKEAK
jgi:hypothetical protein